MVKHAYITANYLFSEDYETNMEITYTSKNKDYKLHNPSKQKCHNWSIL